MTTGGEAEVPALPEVPEAPAARQVAAAVPRVDRVVLREIGLVGRRAPAYRGGRVAGIARQPRGAGGAGERCGHNVALASLANFTLPGDLSPSDRYWERDIVEPAWTMDSGGWMRVPHDRPGIGVTVDTARVEALTVRREELRG